MIEHLLEKYAVGVPRYTSYPTAPHFSENVTADTYSGWLSELTDPRPVSLYMHIPYCAEMCWYCGCLTKIVKRYEPISTYVDSLTAEIDLVASHLPERFKAGAMHWGGGSPTMLNSDDWKRTFATLHERFEFGSDADIAVEMDPRTTTLEYVAALAECGVNRVSIGVQDFDEKVQKAINRIQPYEVTARVVGWLRDAGITNINLDLMYGLPHQTIALVEDMTDKALSLAPSRIALFGYAHVPWMKKHQRLIPTELLPDTLERYRQSETAAKMLVEAGFTRIGLDHFSAPQDTMTLAAQDGSLRRNFQGYTTDTSDTMLGFGASSIGNMPQGYVQNTSAVANYARSVADGELPIARGLKVSAEDMLHRDAINMLMCDLRLDVAALCEQHGVADSRLDFVFERLANPLKDGLMTLNDRTIQVTDAGRPLVRVIAAAFDEYLAHAKARHSIAI